MARRSRAEQPTPGSLADQHIEADPCDVARTVVLRRLTSAPRTRHELEVDLRQRGIPDDAIMQVLDRFEEVGLVDDVAFAHAWADARLRTRGAARRVLRQELKAKGVDDEVIEETLDEISSADEREAALRIVERKWRSVENLADDARRRRLFGVLQRRGHSYATAMYAIDDVQSRLG